MRAALGPPASRRETGASRTISTDTRAIVPGALFVALAGERFDGHDHLAAAAAAGAAAAVVRQGTPPVAGLTLLRGPGYAARLRAAGARPAARSCRPGRGGHRHQRKDQHQGDAGRGAPHPVRDLRHPGQSEQSGRRAAHHPRGPGRHRGAGRRGRRQPAGRDRPISRDHRARRRRGHQRGRRTPGGFGSLAGVVEEKLSLTDGVPSRSWAPIRRRSPRGPESAPGACAPPASRAPTWSRTGRARDGSRGRGSPSATISFSLGARGLHQADNAVRVWAVAEALRLDRTAAAAPWSGSRFRAAAASCSRRAASRS